MVPPFTVNILSNTVFDYVVTGNTICCVLLTRYEAHEIVNKMESGEKIIKFYFSPLFRCWMLCVGWTFTLFRLYTNKRICVSVISTAECVCVCWAVKILYYWSITQKALMPLLVDAVVGALWIACVIFMCIGIALYLCNFAEKYTIPNGLCVIKLNVKHVHRNLHLFEVLSIIMALHT